MVGTKFIAAIVALSTLATAIPTKRQGKEFYLKTEVIRGNASKNNLYVVGYHTGAGFADATLTVDMTKASKAFLNGTQLQFDYGNDYAYGLNTAYNGNEVEWQPTQINIGYGTGDFVSTSSGINATSGGWSGWLACDWSHGVPQLFWKQYRETLDLPCSCAEVNLQPVAYF